MTSLRRQAARGVLWTGTGSDVTTTLQFIQWAVLARLLAPEDFGLMSMAMIVIGMADAFTDMGVSSAIIHRRDATRRQLSSLYWLNIVLGVVVFLLVAGLSPMIAKFFNEPEVARLLTLAAIVFLIAPLGQQFRVLLEKELQFNRLARIDMIGAAGGAGTAITTALLGYGVYSLIWGALAGHVIRGDGMWQSDGEPGVLNCGSALAILMAIFPLACFKPASGSSIHLRHMLTISSSGAFWEQRRWVSTPWRINLWSFRYRNSIRS